MNIQTKLNLFLLLLTPLGAAAGGDEQWEALRHQRLNRIERVIVNSDGGDVFLPRDLPATRENFIAQRLYKLVGSQATTLCYSPLSSYTQSTCPLQSGEFLTNDNPSTHYSVHSPTFQVDEGILWHGTAFHVLGAVTYLK